VSKVALKVPQSQAPLSLTRQTVTITSLYYNASRLIIIMKFSICTIFAILSIAQWSETAILRQKYQTVSPTVGKDDVVEKFYKFISKSKTFTYIVITVSSILHLP
jgi:hypothetical protein